MPSDEPFRGNGCMRLANRLRRMIDGMPGEASILLPVACVRAWLATSGNDLEPDLTVADVAELHDRSPVTVRAWIRCGRLRAYRFRGREYRVTRAALEAFQRGEREHPNTPATSATRSNLYQPPTTESGDE